MEEIAPVWYILTGDHIRLDGKEFEVLDKNLALLGDEVGFCLSTEEDLVYRLRPTEEDRARKLRSAQSEWDRTKSRYEDALEDPASVPDWTHWSVNQWAETEGKPAIRWPDTENN